MTKHTLEGLLLDCLPAVTVAIGSAGHYSYSVKFRECSTQPHFIRHAKHPSLLNAARANAPKELLVMVPPKTFSSNPISFFFSVSLLCYQLWHVRHRQGRQMLFPVQVALQLYLRSKDFLPRIQRNKLIFVDNINYLDKRNKLANGITLWMLWILPFTEEISLEVKAIICTYFVSSIV